MPLDPTQFMQAWTYPVCALVLTGFASWFLVRSSGWIQAHAGFLDASQREKVAALEKQALDAAVNYIMHFVMDQGAKFHPTVNGWLMREAAQVAINHAASVLKDNGDDPDTVAVKILAHLPPNVVTTDTTGAIVKPIAVEISPLPTIEGTSHV